MADTAARLYGPAQPGTTNATLYTSAASTQTIVKSVTLVNTTGTAATITLAINGTSDTAANHWLLSAYSVPPNGFVHIPVWEVLEATDTIQGKQGTSAAITATISGVKVT